MFSSGVQQTEGIGESSMELEPFTDGDEEIKVIQQENEGRNLVGAHTDEILYRLLPSV